ncbi:hypothetical protein L195_g048118 [Trifolium pratense]|uniref:Uncharacterized protein n=1 Tax=Trifolium pratense TaxID=57577 RepID=A0A2K3JKD8_TRIPR|nr:hypothetical protein L195_g048118 [Trifolium pratense]
MFSVLLWLCRAFGSGGMRNFEMVFYCSHTFPFILVSLLGVPQPGGSLEFKNATNWLEG